jgi:serine protease inhibitor
VICEGYYDAKITKVDFSNTKDAAAQMNEWCSIDTRGNIDEIVSEGANLKFEKKKCNYNFLFSEKLSSAVVVMINAVYFKGLWTKPFDDQNVIGQFHTKQGQIETQFMTLKSNFYFFESSQLNAKFLRLPYRGKKFSMIVVLPKEADGIDALIEQLDATNLNRALWYMDSVEVEIKMPKFKFDYSTHLNEAIEELGIKEIFTNAASLPSFARGNSVEGLLRVSTIMQKAGISVDEKGSTAYAATEVEIVNKFGGDTTKSFMADHPFLFFIEDETVGNLLFVGKITNPTS